MFMHTRRLQYTVRVDATDPGLMNLLLEQFGAPQGELAGRDALFHAGGRQGGCGPQRHAV